MDNAAKNTYVKNQITNALIELLKTKELSNISVSEITQKAQVSRVSFYRNYETKEAVLREYIEKLFGEWTKEYDEKEEHRSGRAFMGAMFGHFLRYKCFYLLLHERGLSYLLKDVIVGISGPKREYTNGGAYVAAFFAYGIYGWVEEWFERGMQESAEEMAELMARTSGMSQ